MTADLPHPEREQLSAFAAGELNDSVAEAISTHLAVCESCRRDLEGLPEDPLVGLLRPTLPSPPRSLGVAEGARGALPEAFGRYRIERPLGRGGMGSVYLARDVELDRPVALKVSHFTSEDGLEPLERFEREARTAAALHHPHLCPVYDFGRVGEWHYLTMAFVEGRPLSEVTGTGRAWPPRDAGSLVRTLALALAAAHAAGIVHRDLKPANIMLTPQGEPVVVDFGLARQTGAAGERLTRTGAFLGTPTYMAPEQIGGAEAGPAADVWALGVVLYELLAARAPFVGDTPLATMRAAAESDPPPPRSGGPVPRDLETICLKCLEKDPVRRYPHAGELAEDLGRWLAGEPIRARRSGPWEQAVKWARRRPTLAVLACGGAGAAVAVIVLVGALWRNAEARAAAVQDLSTARDELDARRGQLTELERSVGEKREEASRLDTAVRAARGEVRAVRYSRDMMLAQQALEDEAIARLVGLLERQIPGPGEDDPRSFEWRYLWGLCHTSGSLPQPHPQFVARVDASSDGRTLLVCGGGELNVWDGVSRTRCDVLRELRAPVSDAVFHPEGTRVAVASGEGIQLLDWPSGRVVTRLLTNGMIRASVSNLSISPWDGLKVRNGNPRQPVAHAYKLSFSTDGRLLAAAGEDGRVTVWDAGTYRVESEWDARSGPLVYVQFGADGRRLAIIGADRTASIWNPTTGTRLATLGRPSGRAQGIAFAPDGRTLAVAEGAPHYPSAAGAVRLYDATSGEARGAFEVANGGAFSVAYSPDGRTLVTGSNSGRITLRDAATLELQQVLTGHTERVHALAFSRDGRTLTSGGNDKLVRVWDLRAVPSPLVFREPAGRVLAAALAPSGAVLATGSDGGSKVWDVTTGRLRAQNPGGATCVAFSPDARTLATGNAEGAVRLHDGDLLTALYGHTAHVASLAFAPDGRTLVSAAHDGTARLWDLAAGRSRIVLRHDRPKVWGAAFAPDGKTLATSGEDGQVKLWDAATGELRSALPGGSREILFVAYAPDGSKLAAGDWTGVVRLWDLRTGERIDLRGHTAPVVPVAFAPDGKTLVSGSEDGTVKFWDVGARQERFSLKAHRGPVKCLDFSRDGTVLVTGSADGTAKLWRACP